MTAKPKIAHVDVPYEEKLLKMMQYVGWDIPLPVVTAEMWCIYDVKTSSLMHGKLPH